MSLKLLIDMNLSKEWIPLLEQEGHSAIHWIDIGDCRTDDIEIMAWARDHGFIVFTHDLDFGHLLALTQASGPSVFQIRGKLVLPEYMGQLVVESLSKYEAELADGALVVVDARKSRVRVLPIS